MSEAFTSSTMTLASRLASLAPTKFWRSTGGEKEKILRVKVVADPTTVTNYLNFRLVRGHQPNAATELVEAAAKDAYKRFLGPAIEREVRAKLTEGASARAIKVFGQEEAKLFRQIEQDAAGFKNAGRRRGRVVAERGGFSSSG